MTLIGELSHLSMAQTIGKRDSFEDRMDWVLCITYIDPEHLLIFNFSNWKAANGFEFHMK